MRRMVLRATSSKLTSAPVVISPASTTKLSLTRVSAATLERLSCARMASSIASEIWSATLSGWPSETDSEVKRKLLMPWQFLVDKKGCKNNIRRRTCNPLHAHTAEGAGGAAAAHTALCWGHRGMAGLLGFGAFPPVLARES